MPEVDRLRAPTVDARLAWSTLGAVATVMVANVLLSDGVQGGGDSTQHYLIARYAPLHPELFLDQWGKPLYTLLMAPVAQLGFVAAALANVGLLLLTCWFAWRLALALALPDAWLAPLLVGFAPVVLLSSHSGLTEPLAAAWLAAGLLLIVRDRVRSGVLLLSFLPFVRSEGFVVLAMVAGWLVTTRRWSLLPLTAAGSVLFNVLGWFASGGLLWIFSRNPYVQAEPQQYGRGGLFDFAREAIPVFGLMIVALVVDALLALRARALPSREVRTTTDPHASIWRWLILGIPVAYFTAHSVLWWRGWMGSYGLTRVMLVITVPVALLTLRALRTLSTHRWGRRVPQALMLATPVYGLLVAQPLPVTQADDERLAREAARAARSLMPSTATLFAADPLVPLVTERDPYDPQQLRPVSSWRAARAGDFVLWDSHFGANEHAVPKADLDSDPSLTLVQVFAPDTLITTLGGYAFELRLYQRR